MKGRFRKACIRCAKRIGRSDRVKLADWNNAFSDSGGRPCLKRSACWTATRTDALYLTKSARLKACRDWLAKPATSSSAIVVVLGGCDHLWADGDGYLPVLLDRRRRVVNKSTRNNWLLLNRCDRTRQFMVALKWMVLWNAYLYFMSISHLGQQAMPRLRQWIVRFVSFGSRMDTFDQ